jgi:hypothetical protein
MTKKELMDALAAANQQMQAQQAENSKLKAQLAAQRKRPNDALNIGGVVAVFSNGTHKDLIGRQVKCHIPAEAIGSLYASCVVKETSNGNAFLTLRGWIDTSKLDLTAKGSEDSASKATKSVKESLDL